MATAAAPPSCETLEGGAAAVATVRVCNPYRTGIPSVIVPLAKSEGDAFCLDAARKVIHSEVAAARARAAYTVPSIRALNKASVVGF